MTRSTKRTPEELAAFKAANRANSKFKGPVLWDNTKPAQPSHRQQWVDFKNETLGMIEAAKRQRHFHLLPQLMQRLQQANTILTTVA